MTEVKWEDRKGQRWILLEGELDHEGCEEIRSSFLEAARGGEGDTVVDMGEVSFVSSQGIWMLIQAHKELKETGRQLRIRALQPHVHKVFDTVGVFRAIPEWDT